MHIGRNNLKHRILVVDDTEEIHELFKFILKSMEKETSPSKVSNKLDSILAGNGDQDQQANGSELEISLDHAHQGEQALELIKQSYVEDNPYSLVFMDVRMPPGIDGIETIKRARENYKDLEFVICTAFNNYEWDQLYNLFGRNDKILYISKPFCDTSLKQMTNYVLSKVENQKA